MYYKLLLRCQTFAPNRIGRIFFCLFYSIYFYFYKSDICKGFLLSHLLMDVSLWRILMLYKIVLRFFAFKCPSLNGQAMIYELYVSGLRCLVGLM